MANLQEIRRPKVFIELKDGEQVELMMSLEAFAEMEEQYGSVEAAMHALEQNKIKDIKFLLWAATLHLDNPMSAKQLAGKIDIRRLTDVVKSLTQVMAADAPAAIEGGANNGVDPN